MFVLLLCWAFPPVLHKTVATPYSKKSSPPPPPLVQSVKTAPKKQQQKRQEPKARGVILKFHRLPTAKQSRLILKKMKELGLKRTRIIKSFKIWLFQWPSDLKPAQKAWDVCKSLSKIPQLEYCEPDAEMQPATGGKKSLTEAGYSLKCDNCEISESSLKPISQDISKCNLVKSSGYLQSRLSDYWAQELIGADLLKEELKKLPPPKKNNFVTTLDSPLKDHYIHVNNLISDKGPHAVLPQLKREQNPLYGSLIHIGDVLYVTATSFFEKPPSFVNHSMYWHSRSRTLYHTFKSISPPSVIVTAAGNLFPDKINKRKALASKNYDAVIVGSFSQTGFVSDFSQEGEEVHILAPSDNYLISKNRYGDKEQFGGTSGATPLVTGSLAGFEWISGYHPNAKESKILLERTAIPTVHSHEKPKRNGVGLLNAYKMGMVGKRIKKKCAGRPPSCFSKEIKKQENYRFPLDPKLRWELRSTFPQCSNSETKKTTSAVTCEDKKRVFKKLRQEILLNPTNKNLWETLSCIYKNEKLWQNEELLQKIIMSLGSNESVMKNLVFLAYTEYMLDPGLIRAIRGMSSDFPEVKPLLARLTEGKDSAEAEEISLLSRMAEDPDPELRKAIVKVVIQMSGAEGRALLNRLVKDENQDVRKEIIHQARRIGGSEGIRLLNLLAEDPDPDIREMVSEYASKIGGAEGIRLLNRLAEDPDPEVRKDVAYRARQIGGAEGIRLLNRLAEDPDPEVRKDIAYWAAKVGGIEGLNLLNQLAEDPDPEVRKRVVYATEDIGRNEGLSLLNQLAEDKNPNVRKQVIYQASRMGGAEVIRLLNRLAEDPEVGWYAKSTLHELKTKSN